MSKEPKKRLPVDAWYFELVKQAYGNKCCACGKSQSELKDPLQRGHITLHAEGGTVEPENLIPVCLPCNKKYAKSDTPFNHFPEDWRERLAGLLLLRLDPKYHVSGADGHADMVLKSKPTESTRLLNLKISDFGLPAGVYSCSQRRGLTPHEKQATIRELIAASRTCDTPPNYPIDRRQMEMRRILDDHGRATFLRVGTYYLQQQPWMTPDKRFIQDSWGQFTEGFDFLLREVDQKAAAQSAAKQKQREAELRQRWNTYKRAGECGDWPGMTDAERVFRDKANLETDMRQVTTEELGVAEDMPRREFLAKKKCCEDFIYLCVQIMMTAGDEAHTVDFLHDRLKEIKTVEGLHGLHAGIKELYSELHQLLAPGPGPEAFLS